jgi:hypothetical protein
VPRADEKAVRGSCGASSPRRFAAAGLGASSGFWPQMDAKGFC